MAKKIKIFILISLVLFGLLFSFKELVEGTACPLLLTTFSDGSASKMVTLPAGGGKVEAGKISLPQGSQVCSARLTFDKTVGPGITIGTPFIWVPLSDTNKLVQIRTSDGKVIHIFSNGSDNCGSNAFKDPSRITVFPGGDVWVANRGGGSVTRLGLKTGCTGDDCYECKGTYSDIGDGPRGITFDADGDIWVGAYYNDKICKYSDSTSTCKYSGCKTYGMIGDSAGNVWIADAANGKVCKCSGDISCSSGFSASVYGIGVDNEGDIWVGNPSVAEVNEIKGAGYGPSAGTLLQSCSMPHNNTGIAVDGNNNVWNNGHWNNQTYVIKGGDCSKVFTKSNVCTRGLPHGVAIDENNNGWIVCRTGEVIKYAFHDDGDAIFVDDGNNDIEEILRIDLSVCCDSGTTANASYNYSDMTGFRTVALNLTIGNFSIPISHFPQEISGTAFASWTEETLENCDCDGCTFSDESFCGNPFCEIPISVSSIFFSGNYSLSDLEIYYKQGPSRITGGLVPCGRRCDDPNTEIREDASCTICHFFVLSKRTIDFLFKSLILPLTLLMFVIAGVKFVGAVGSPEKISEAKTIALAAILGFLIAFSAWLIINSALSFVVHGKPPALSEAAKIFGQPWSEINCPVP